MNILEQEDLIKGATDDILLQEAKSPTGRVPQFLVISEIQRRKSMRDRFSAQEQQPEQSVAEKIVAGAAPQGIGALQPPQMPPQMPPQAPVMAIPPPQMPPEMMAAQMPPMPPPPQMMAAGGGRMPYRRMADGGMIPPNALVEDAAKFNPEGLNDIDPSEMEMASPTDMGIPKVIKEVVSSIRDTADIGNIGFDGRNITGRGSVMVPIKGNPLELGANAFLGSDGAGIAGLDASYQMPKSNLSFGGTYRPGRKSWQANFVKNFNNDRYLKGQLDSQNKSIGVQYGGRFNQGGLVRMQDEGQVPAPPGLPLDPMAPYAAQQEQRYEELRKYIEDISASEREAQKDEMMSQALINIGAGIASGNVAAGLEKAGAQVANTKAAQRKREQALQLQLMKERPGSTGLYTDLPATAKEIEYLFSLNPALRDLPPAQLQALFFDVKRQNYELAEVNGVQTIVRKVGNLFFDQSNNPVVPDAGTVTTAVPGVTSSAPTSVPVTDAVEVPAADEPERVLWGGVDAEGNEIRRSYLNSPIFMQPLETIEGLAKVADYKEDRQLIRDLRREREEGAHALKSRLEGQIASTNRIQTTLNRMFDNTDSWSVGHGTWLKGMTESDALTMSTDLKQIQGNLAFDRLQEMREASPTGGALGQVSEVELELLKSAMQSINQKLSPEEFKTRLLEVKRLYSQLRDKSLQDYAFSMATTTNPEVRAEYDTQMQMYKKMIDGTTPASEADKETAQKILNEYNSIIGARNTQGLQGGGMVSVDSSGEDLEYLNRLRSDIASLRGARSQ